MLKKLTRIDVSTIVFLLLVGLTILAWMIAKTGISDWRISLIILMMSLFKGFLIGDYFMELANVKSFWRWSVMLWLLIPGMLIGYAFFI